MATNSYAMTPTPEPAMIKLPGFGLPYDDWGRNPANHAHAMSAVMSWDHKVTTIRERCMLFLIDKISDKPQWMRKVHDQEIVAKWKQEAEELEWAKVIKNGDMSDDMFTYCMAELRHKAELCEQTGIIPVLDASSCVLKSDDAISHELKEQLREAVAPLENVPDPRKDWHPGSNGTVLDLVHPSLFPLIYKRSRILPDATISLENCLQSIGTGVVVPSPLRRDVPAPGWGSTAYKLWSRLDQWLPYPAHRATGAHQDTRESGRNSTAPELWSHRFQWLPCNVSFPDGENARIDSYINNLHPDDHKDLYQVIEKIITKAVPFWNIVCQSAPNNGRLQTTPRIRCDAVNYTYPEGINESLPDDFDGDEIDFYETVRRQRIYSLPEPRDFGEPDITVDDVERKFTFLDLDNQKDEKRIQVIVKLANIQLTPEKPEYKGGSWHIEGQLNEHIISTALYYYDSSNITESRLHFRTKVAATDLIIHTDYEQDDHLGFKNIWGVDYQAENEQRLGSVLTREDRLIAFPNGFQHRVGDFKLADPSKPGHRKILALFLVAPSIPIISTANVPPQQRDWWTNGLEQDQNEVAQLPAELIDTIAEDVKDFPISLEEAKIIREELMMERAKISEAVDQKMFDHSFNFCEH